MNTNCLEGISCPECNQDEAFEVQAVTKVMVTDDGAEDMDGNFEWDDSSVIVCRACRHHGTIGSFKPLDSDVTTQPDDSAMKAGFTDGPLEHEEDNDYILKDGEPSCWIKVGNMASVYVQDTGDGVSVAIFPLGHADLAPSGSVDVSYDDLA